MIRSMPAAVLALLLAGCTSEHPGDTGSVFRHFSIVDGAIAVHAEGITDTMVDADGGLTIAGNAIATGAGQRQLLARYHDGILQLRSDGVAVGRAGIRTAGKAIGSVVAGLVSGKPDKIEAKVDARAREVEQRVAELCDTLRGIRSTQDAIAAQVEAFRPYATITADDAGHCR